MNSNKAQTPFPPVASLVLHAAPMLLIDRVIAADEDSMQIEIFITQNSLFFIPCHGVPGYVGIEYIAQTVAAYSGWRAQQAAPGSKPKIGFLLGSRKMTMARDWFPADTRLEVHVKNIFEDGEMGVFDGEIRDGNDVIVSARINVYQPEHPSGSSGPSARTSKNTAEQ
ncbi:MAG: 3-hydroxylacyl-ACP dehydratase [Pseudomonadota bacterium]